MFQSLHRGYWWFRKRFNRVVRIDGVDIIFIDAADQKTPEAVAQVVTIAFREVSGAKGGFGELVMSHLRFVAAKRVQGSFAMPVVRGFVSPFAGREGSDPRYLAARLVWAATHVRLFRDATVHNRPRARGEIRQAAFEAQLRFLQQLPNTSELQEYVRDQGP